MPNIDSERGALDATATTRLRGAGLDGVAAVEATLADRTGGTGRAASGSRPPLVGAVRSAGGAVALAEVWMAAARAAPPAGVVTTAGLVGPGSVGSPPPVDGAADRGPTRATGAATTGEEMVGEQITDGGTGGVLECEPPP